MGAIKITKVIDYIADYCILFGDGKSWYGKIFISFSGFYQSRRLVQLQVCYPHGYQAHGPNLTESARWSFLVFQDGVSSAFSFPPSLKHG